MNFQSEYLYHIYNRGNNSQLIFFNHENEVFFLRKVRKELLPYCDILAYCLMPTHFHFMVYVKNTVLNLNIGQTSSNHPLIKGISILLSSYTRAINIQEGRTGSLFQKKTKAKCLNPIKHNWKNISTNKDNYAFNCINYIHQNPIKSGLIKLMENWEYSSFKDYIGKRNGTLCNKKLAFELIPFFEKENFYKLSYQVISPEMIDKIL